MSVARRGGAIVIGVLLGVCGVTAAAADEPSGYATPSAHPSAAVSPDAHAPLDQPPPHAGYAASEWRIDAIDRTGLELGFTVDLLQVDAAVLISQEDGTAVSVADPETVGRTVSLQFANALTDGTYDVRWHVVAADGQPMEARFTASFAAGSESPRIEYAALEPRAGSTVDDRETRAAPHGTTQANQEPGLDARPVLWALGGALLGLLGYLGVLSWRRNRHADHSEER